MPTADVVFGVLAVTAFTSEDLGSVAACYLALDIFVVPLLLTFGLTALGTGLVLGMSSGWGIIRYWWVAAKLLINVVLSSLVFLLAPRLASAGPRPTASTPRCGIASAASQPTCSSRRLSRGPRCWRRRCWALSSRGAELRTGASSEAAVSRVG